MTSLKSINRRVGSLFAVAALVLATVTPGLVPAFASAAQVTERSIELSSSSRGAQDVSYKISFNGNAAGAFAVEFCANSPLVNAECTFPAGFSVAGVTTDTDNYTVQETTASAAGATTEHNAVAVTGTVGATTSVQLDGINNPSTAAPMYARIVTYATEAEALAYASQALGTHVDEGSAAVSITDTIGVSGAVLEAMTFCVAKNAIDKANCTRVDAAPLQAPSLKLGETTGTVTALSATAVSEGSIFSQLSTNAAGGAVVSLKSGNTCGGLKRAEATDCDIAAALAAGINQGEAKFGVKVVPGSDPSTGSNGTLQIAGTGTTPYYSSSVFKLNYLANATSGVTSPFGDHVLDTANGPVNSKNAQITFGASIANNTPAGLYSNDFSLIATGKF